MTLTDRNHLIYAIGRATVCGLIPSIIGATLESDGYSTTVTIGTYVVSLVAMQIFVSTRSSDPIENEIASDATYSSNRSAALGMLGGFLGRWTFSSYFSIPCSSLASDIGAACLGSLGALPSISGKFLQEHDRRIISNVRVVQQ